MTGFGEMLGKTGEAAWQLFVWQVMGEIVSAALTPYLTELTYLVNEKHPDIVLPVNDLVTGVIRGHIAADEAAADAAKLGIDGDRFGKLLEIARPKLAAADLAQLVVRNFMPRDAAVTEAALTGVDAHRFDLLTRIAGDAPSPTDLVIALRREIIPEDNADPLTPSFAGGIREGRLADMWIPMLKELGTEWPTPTDALEALLQGQLAHDDALALYKRLGGDPQFLDVLYHTRGNGPTPNEALELWNRGIIAETGAGPDALSYEQAFRESRFRDKWMGPYKALRFYVIPPRSVVAMVHQGTLDDPKAAAELAKSGVAPDTAAALIAEGHARASSADKALTQSTVLTLYEDNVITEADALGLLKALKYSDDNAHYLVELATLRRAAAALNSAVSRVHNLYVAHKIKRDAAVTTLGNLGIPNDQGKAILRDWDLEAAVNVKVLTPAEITSAWGYQVITTGEAMTELQNLGYTAFDSWVLLSNKAKGPIEGKPPQGPNPIGTVP